MRKILFLDIDGVLNPKWWERKVSVDKFGCAFDSKCVAYLKKILDETGAEIVVSSSWKCMGLADMQNMWKNRSLPGKVVDITPDMMSDEMLLNEEIGSLNPLDNRGCEIKGWLSKHEGEVLRYAVIDDMDDILPEQLPYFVQTDADTGISMEDVKKTVMILKS